MFLSWKKFGRRYLLLAALLGLLFPVSAWSFGVMPAGSNPSVVEEWAGVIRYTKLSDNSFRGEEQWRTIVHPDQSRTIEMTVRLDAAETSRVTVLRVDAEFRPIDAYQTLWTAGEFRGSGYFWVTGNTLQAVVTANNGTLQQQVAVPDGFSWVAHPLGADGLHMWYYDEAQGGVQPIKLYNMDTLGKTVGSILGTLDTYDLELIGEEQIEVPAGKFMTKKYLLANALEVWVDVETRILVKTRNTPGDFLYELTKLEKMVIDK